PRFHINVHHRRSERRDSRLAAHGLPAAGHLLHRGALPLRALRGLDLRALLWDLLLVAQDHRPFAERADRGLAFLADVHRLQPDLRADAFHRPKRHAPPHLYLSAEYGLGLLAPD